MLFKRGHLKAGKWQVFPAFSTFIFFFQAMQAECHLFYYRRPPLARISHMEESRMSKKPWGLSVYWLGKVCYYLLLITYVPRSAPQPDFLKNRNFMAYDFIVQHDTFHFVIILRLSNTTHATPPFVGVLMALQHCYGYRCALPCIYRKFLSLFHKMESRFTLRPVKYTLLMQASSSDEMASKIKNLSEYAKSALQA